MRSGELLVILSSFEHHYIQSFTWRECFDYTPKDSDDPRTEAQKEANQEWMEERTPHFYSDVGWSDEYDDTPEPAVTVDLSYSLSLLAFIYNFGELD